MCIKNITIKAIDIAESKKIDLDILMQDLHDLDVEITRKRPIGYVYEDGRKFDFPKPRKKVVEDPPEEGWGPGYSISVPNPSRL